MLSLTSRGLRLSLGILFVLGAFSLAPTTAHAQWSGPVCIDASDVPELFFGTYTGLDNCESLCKKTASYCKKFVKDAASCEQTDNTGSWYFIEKTQCDTQEDKADRKSCREEVNGIRKDTKESIESDKDEALANCEAYKANCIDACSAPL